MQGIADAWHAGQCMGFSNLPLARFLCWTLGDALYAFGLRGDAALVGLLSMLVEDTVHSTVDAAPLPNAALGVSIRGAGLARARGGMRGFFTRFVAHYRSLGGELLVGSRVERIAGEAGQFMISTRQGALRARQVVCALPAACVAAVGPPAVADALRPHLLRNATKLGGAVVAFLGVPEHEVACQRFTHHQLLHDYDRPLGSGNNMFISVSSPDDLESAPPGFRAVMISTHCELAPWQSLEAEAYEARKREAADSLLGLSRRVYPELGTSPAVFEVGTPRTYERFTRRPLGAVGGYRLTLDNANQRAIPHDVGVPGFYLAGDTTWPGLGTVACVLSSRIVAEKVLERWTALDPVHSQPREIHAEPQLPELEALGRDLLVTTPWQRRLALARPFLGVCAFALAAWAGWWWLTPLVLFLIFVAVVTVTHDVVHGSLGLGPLASDWALFALGAVLLESGHAYRATHHQHHQVFPGPDDPEGDPARMSLAQAVLHGPWFLPKLWLWAFRRRAGYSREQAWLLIEACVPFLVVAVGILLLQRTPALLVYAVGAIAGSWVYPLLTVHLPHRGYGDSPLTQTSTLRGRMIPALFLELTYHLEHHLYPQVPSHHLPELSRRLEPVFRQAGVRPRRVP